MQVIAHQREVKSIPPVCQRTHEVYIARQRLSAFVVSQAQLITRVTGINYEENDCAPETWPEVKTMFQQASLLGKVVYVRKSDSDNTVYNCQYANWAFRFWHDYLHFKHDLSFSFIDEILVGQYQADAVAREFGMDSLEAKLMKADTLGQVLHFNVHGAHVSNQLDFVLSVLQVH